MRICVPLLSSDTNDVGSNSLQLAAHFGLAQRFSVVDSCSGEILSECGISSYCPGPCHCPLPNLVGSGVDALAGESMGFRLMQLSSRAKLAVLAIKAKTLGELRHEMHSRFLPLALSAGTSLTNTLRQAGCRKK